MLLRQFQHWTPEEDTDLRLVWSELTNEALERRFNRSMPALNQRATFLGMTHVPQGMESLKQAAARLGFHYRSFVKIVAWSGARTMVSRKSKPGEHTKHRLIEAGTADAVAEAWLATATPAEWAHERGVTPGILMSVMKHAREQGLVAKHMAFGRQYRLTGEEFSVLAAAWDARVEQSRKSAAELLRAIARTRLGKKQKKQKKGKKV